MRPADFGAFFRALWGYSPFPWQQRLLEHVVENGRYPDTLSLGTGTGKTSIIDIHLFALALEAERNPAARRLPRRLFFVVDRRVVVDQTADRAETIANRLADPDVGIVRDVASVLGSLTSARRPVAAVTLRGGIRRDNSWANAPDQPLVVATTVDQVGSRLLFRGYGVSGNLAPVHAGLVGADSLVVLDEVHLAVPFQQTLAALQRNYRRDAVALPDRWQVVAMSATPQSATGEVFELADDDVSHPVLARRLAAARPARLVELKVKGSDTKTERSTIAKAAASETLEMVGSGHRAIGVVVNRVDIAREVWVALAANRRLAKADATIILLTGRMRGIDKNVVQAQLSAVRAGRDVEPETPVIVVSTQCIEAGADLDFGALVTQSAAMDALRQRFGRLNRFGRYGTEPDLPAPTATVLLTQENPKNPDPVYGTGLDATSSFLRECATEADNTEAIVDFGIDELDARLALLSDERRRGLSSPTLDAPVLLPTYVDLWTQTRPRPWPDPDVSPFLHGPQHAHDVQIIWRRDVGEYLPAPDEVTDLPVDAGELIKAAMEAMPPSGLEALSVPIYAARAWLEGADNATVADVPVATWEPKPTASDARVALRWKGEDSQFVKPRHLRPGDTLVVPCSYGGLNGARVWDPSAREPVEDMASPAQWTSTRRAFLRARLFPESDLSWIPRVLGEGNPTVGEGPLETPAKQREAVNDWLKGIRASSTRAWLTEVAQHLITSRWNLLRVGRDMILVGRRPAESDRRSHFEADLSEYIGDVDPQELTIARHNRDVAAVARAFADNLGLPADIVDDIGLAASLHDIGKADPRCQRMLAGGDPVRAAMLREPIAKSGTSPSDREAREKARRAAGYPIGTRHELMSLALAEASPDLDMANDPELVRHLIASHHGWCRPMAPPVADVEPVQVTHPSHPDITISSDHGLARIGSGVADRFYRLNERYGPHQLAWLEAILRLADHRASEATEPGAKQ